MKMTRTTKIRPLSSSVTATRRIPFTMEHMVKINLELKRRTRLQTAQYHLEELAKLDPTAFRRVCEIIRKGPSKAKAKKASPGFTLCQR